MLAKIKEIRNYIAAALQDENTGNLLSYLSDLEKDVKGKKYSLVFEEHREEIGEVLDTHTPVLTEDKELFIDNGGQMNFLIEGDNLASLHLLEKTHKGKIDLIYIDPPYNILKEGFTYSENLNLRHLNSKFFNRCVSKFDNEFINCICISSFGNQLISQIVQTVDNNSALVFINRYVVFLLLHTIDLLCTYIVTGDD